MSFEAKKLEKSLSFFKQAKNWFKLTFYKRESPKKGKEQSEIKMITSS